MKIKYRKGAEYGEWSREDRAAIRRWDRVALVLGIVLALAAAVGVRCGTLELGEPDRAGFVMWFLLCCAYPVLGLIGLANMLFGWQETALMRFLVHDNQILGLILINAVTFGTIWAVGRCWGLRWIGAEKLRICANFLSILAGWGVLQLLLFGVGFVWQGGGFGPLHDRLRADEPERVIVVEKVTETPVSPAGAAGSPAAGPGPAASKK